MFENFVARTFRYTQVILTTPDFAGGLGCVLPPSRLVQNPQRREFAKKTSDEGSVSGSNTGMTGTGILGRKKKALTASGNGCDGGEGGSDSESSHLAPAETERGITEYGERGVPHVAKRVKASRQTAVYGTIDETVDKKFGRRASLEQRGGGEAKEKRKKQKSVDAAGGDRGGKNC